MGCWGDDKRHANRLDESGPRHTRGQGQSARRGVGALRWLPCHGLPRWRVVAPQFPRCPADPSPQASWPPGGRVDPVRRMAGTGIDISAVVVGSLLPLTSISEQLAKTYRKHLFGNAALQDLPDSPRFVFNATNLESGVLMRFSKPYMGRPPMADDAATATAMSMSMSGLRIRPTRTRCAHCASVRSSTRSTRRRGRACTSGFAAISPVFR